MISSLAALEFGRVLELVASFARSGHGRERVRNALPHFDGVRERELFAQVQEVARLLDTAGPLPFAGLDGVALLLGDAPPPAEPRTLAELVGLVRRIVETRAVLAAHRDAGPWLAGLAQRLPELAPLLAFCEQRLSPDGEVLDTATPALAQARAGRERHRGAILDALQRLARRHRGLGGPPTVRRERYCLPVPASERQRLPGLTLDVSGSGGTLFVEPFEVVDLNNAYAEATARAREEEERVRSEIIAAFQRSREAIVQAAADCAELDALQARVLFGKTAGGALLSPACGDGLHLRGARHPLLDPALAPLRETVLGEAGNTGPVTPLDLELGTQARLVLLSGPNAGGKTVALKTVGLTVAMAHAGIPVLAAEGSALPPLRQLWCRIGDDQNLLADQSTFSAAMTATAALLETVNPATLVLYDELGSGTDPEEGAALAAALLEELVRRGCWVVATAHLVTVAAHIEHLDGATNAAMGYDEASGRPTYRLALGVPGRSHGLAIARRCGLPTHVVERASQLVSESFLAIDTYLSRLDAERRLLIAEREALREALHQAATARAAAEAAQREAEAARRRVEQQWQEERERLRQRAAQQLAAALAELAVARERGEFPGKKRLAALRHAALDLGPPPVAAQPAAELAEGVPVAVAGIRSPGVVSRLLGERVEVVIGNKRLWVDRSACRPLGEPATPPPTVQTTAPSPDAQPRELKLLGMTQEEAREELERFLDQALLAGVSTVRIVHGHGSGTLRRLVREVVRQHPAVVRYGSPPQHLGGTGVTEVVLE